MFIGRYYHHLEAKGRVSLPKTFRDQVTEWIVTRGLDGGLFLFPKSEYAQQLQQLTASTFTKQSHRDFVRLMANDAKDVQVDAQGRVQLPEYLIEFADLQKQVVVVGSYTWVEIWNQDLYHNYLKTVEPNAEKIAESIETT
ncbi:division/cell wall cluster transcriptional repressor MraZ [Candidatus Woesebacteria bacterium]|nr:division/cell wall cluster transcriptional repressor MraZ [Candidatus Woesebacteria bacterium]